MRASLVFFPLIVYTGFVVSMNQALASGSVDSKDCINSFSSKAPYLDIFEWHLHNREAGSSTSGGSLVQFSTDDTSEQQMKSAAKLLVGEGVITIAPDPNGSDLNQLASLLNDKFDHARLVFSPETLRRRQNTTSLYEPQSHILNLTPQALLNLRATLPYLRKDLVRVFHGSLKRSGTASLLDVRVVGVVDPENPGISLAILADLLLRIDLLFDQIDESSARTEIREHLKRLNGLLSTILFSGTRLRNVILKSDSDSFAIDEESRQEIKSRVQMIQMSVQKAHVNFENSLFDETCRHLDEVKAALFKPI